MEGTHSLTDLPLSDTEWSAHSFFHSLTHSLTKLPRSHTKWRTRALYFHPKIRGHAHSNSLSHPDWRARSLTPPLSFTHSLIHLLSLSLTRSLTHELTFTLYSLTNTQ